MFLQDGFEHFAAVAFGLLDVLNAATGSSENLAQQRLAFPKAFLVGRLSAPDPYSRWSGLLGDNRLTRMDEAAGAFIGLPPYLSANRQIVELRGRLWKTKAGLALCNKVRRLSSQLLGLATVIIAHFSKGLFRSTAAREVGLRMEKFGVF